MGAIWVDPKYADLLSAGSHGTTYGGNPLGCAVAQAVLDVVEEEGLEENVRTTGAYLLTGLHLLKERHPTKITDIRGLGFMVGIVLKEHVAGEFVEHLHRLGMLTVPAGTNVCRLLPALNTTVGEVDECLEMLDRGLSAL